MMICKRRQKSRKKFQTKKHKSDTREKKKKKKAKTHKTELLCVFFFFFCKVRFPKAWGCLRFTSAATEYLFSRKSSGKCRDEVKHKR